MKLLENCLSCPLYKMLDHDCLLENLCESYNSLELCKKTFNFIELKTFMYKQALLKSYDYYVLNCSIHHLDINPDIQIKLDKIIKMSPEEICNDFENNNIN